MNFEAMRHLAAIGPGAPLTIFNWVVAAGRPVTQAWLEQETGLSNAEVYRALLKLKTLEYVVQTTDGWEIVKP